MERYININTQDKYMALLASGLFNSFFPELTGEWSTDSKIIEGNPAELNEFGLLLFKHKTNKRLFLVKSYRWVDQLTLLDETESRQIIDTYKFSTYNLSAWSPVTKEEYAKVEEKFRDIYN
jgi:hypothetical protein